ncbi:hypothetical protein HYT33_01080 [Candidatus Roizmanbacteria bacterium]|nr:hypothetical protein [Candidatus Roizmanbacteria bacterium]
MSRAEQLPSRRYVFPKKNTTESLKTNTRSAFELAAGSEFLAGVYLVKDDLFAAIGLAILGVLSFATGRISRQKYLKEARRIKGVRLH